MNKTPLSNLLTIQFAENLLNLVPRGTHDYEKYVTPSQFRTELHQVGCKVLDIKGMIYHPLENTWKAAPDGLPECVLVNYILVAIKL